MKRLLYSILFVFLFLISISLDIAKAVNYSCHYSVQYSENGVSIYCPNICTSTFGDHYGLCQFAYDKRVGNFHLTGLVMVPIHYDNSVLDLSFNTLEMGPLHLRNESTGEVYEIQLENVNFILDLSTFSIIDASDFVKIDGARMDIRPIKETAFQFLWL